MIKKNSPILFFENFTKLTTIKNDFNKRIAVNIFIISNNIIIKLFKIKFSYNDESLSID
jgi:hypothetical protein